MRDVFSEFIDELTAPMLAKAKRLDDMLKEFEERDRREGGILKQIEERTENVD